MSWKAIPHSVIEGMIIGAYAIGAHEGFVYVRDEYPLAIQKLRIALRRLRRLVFLGERYSRFGFFLQDRTCSGEEGLLFVENRLP